MIIIGQRSNSIEWNGTIEIKWNKMLRANNHRWRKLYLHYGISLVKIPTGSSYGDSQLFIWINWTQSDESQLHKLPLELWNSVAQNCMNQCSAFMDTMILNCCSCIHFRFHIIEWKIYVQSNYHWRSNT